LRLEVWIANLVAQPACSHFCWAVSKLFHNIDKWGWCFFFTTTV